MIVVGNFVYGMAVGGGTAGKGIIYRVGTDGAGFTIMHSFGGSPNDGRSPNGELVLDASGSRFYGTTYYGGTADLGTVFSLNTDGSNYNVLHSLLGGPGDGANPNADPLLLGSTLYLTTVFGGDSNNGTVLAITVPEPSSLFLTATAAAGVALVVRRGQLDRLRTSSRRVGTRPTPQ